MWAISLLTPLYAEAQATKIMVMERSTLIEVEAWLWAIASNIILFDTQSTLHSTAPESPVGMI